MKVLCEIGTFLVMPNSAIMTSLTLNIGLTLGPNPQSCYLGHTDKVGIHGNDQSLQALSQACFTHKRFSFNVVVTAIHNTDIGIPSQYVFLAVLELITRLTWNSQTSACLCLPSARIKVVCHPPGFSLSITSLCASCYFY